MSVTILDLHMAQLLSNWPHNHDQPHPNMPASSVWHQRPVLARTIMFSALANHASLDPKDFATTVKDLPDRMTGGPIIVREDPFRPGMESTFAITSYLNEQTKMDVVPIEYGADHRQIGPCQVLFISQKEEKGITTEARHAELQKLFHRDTDELYLSDFRMVPGYVSKPDAAMCTVHRLDDDKLLSPVAIDGIIEDHVKMCLGFRDVKFGGKVRPNEKYTPDFKNWGPEYLRQERKVIQQFWTTRHEYFKRVTFAKDASGFIPLDPRKELPKLSKEMLATYRKLETQRRGCWQDPGVLAHRKVWQASLSAMRALRSSLQLDVRPFSHLEEFSPYEELKMFVSPPIPRLAPFTDTSVSPNVNYSYPDFWQRLSVFKPELQALALHFKSNATLYTNVKTQTTKKAKICVLAMANTDPLRMTIAQIDKTMLDKDKFTDDGKFIVICDDKEMAKIEKFLGNLSDYLKCPLESLLSTFEARVDENITNALIPRSARAGQALSAAASASAAISAAGGLGGKALTLTTAAKARGGKAAAKTAVPAVGSAIQNAMQRISLDDFKAPTTNFSPMSSD